MDIRRIAAMIAECDDDDELTEVLAEVYKMLPAQQQAAFRAATGPAPGAATWDEDRRQRDAQEAREAAVADFRRRAEARAERMRRALEAASSATKLSPEE
uniref:hypothetical protein n=1 Tax=Trebonia sp. TaxID=2767075 RepID=UPI002636E501